MGEKWRIVIDVNESGKGAPFAAAVTDGDGREVGSAVATHWTTTMSSRGVETEAQLRVEVGGGLGANVRLEISQWRPRRVAADAWQPGESPAQITPKETHGSPTCRGCRFLTSDSFGDAHAPLCAHPAWESPCEHGYDDARPLDVGDPFRPTIPPWCPLPESERPRVSP
jgi:hypothetical protein